MIRIHLFEHGGLLGEKTFPEFPSNSYETNDVNILFETIKDILDNHNSGIGKILIENDEFGWDCGITDAQSVLNLDKI